MNTIELAKKYLPLLDEVYKMGAKSSILDAPAQFIRESMNAKEVLLPKIVIDGLGDYSRSGGYVEGDVDFTWQTHTFTQDRGRSFQIDAQDNMETLDVAFSALTGQFIRTKVVPEVDAYRFASLAGSAVVGNIVAGALDKDTALQAIDTGKAKLMDAEVDLGSVVAFITPTIYNYLKQSNLIVRQFVTNVGLNVINREIEVLDGTPIVIVPQNRFYTEITMYDGTTAGQEAGGYIKAVGAKDINFVLVDVNVAMGVKKTVLPRIFDPQTNQSANAWKFDYRLYHDIFVPDNKTVGVYLHTVV